MKNILFSGVALVFFLVGCIIYKLLCLRLDPYDKHPLKQLVIVFVLFILYCTVFALLAKTLGIIWEEPPI